MMSGPDNSSMLCIGFTPAVQRTLTFSALEMDEVNRAKAVQLSAAGKGVNLARVLKRLGAAPLATGFLGGDSGRFVDHSLTASGVDCDWIWTDSETRHCHTLIEKESGRITELVEEAATPSEEDWAGAFELIERRLDRAGWVAATGALPPGSPVDVYARIARSCRRNGVRFVLDSQKEPLLEVLPERPFLVKLNTHELGNTLQCELADPDAVLEGMRSFQRLGADAVLVTQGPDAAYLVQGAQAFVLRPPKIQAVNPIGSGDSVTAGMIHALDCGQTMEQAAAFGLACGSANALTSRPGELDPDTAEALCRDVRVSLV